MAKKLEVPEEFTIFLDNALDVVDSTKGDSAQLHTTIENLAKFRYYLKGMADQLDIHASLTGVSKESLQYIAERLDLIRKQESNLNVIFKALVDANTG